jgi:hypothetical protein
MSDPPDDDAVELPAQPEAVDDDDAMELLRQADPLDDQELAPPQDSPIAQAIFEEITDVPYDKED